MNKSIGIVSVLFDRGAGNICLQIKQALQWYVPNWNISILARMSATDGKKQIKYWDNCFHNNLLLYPEYKIQDEDFEQWIKANKLDTIIFVEEHFTKNLLPICQKLSIKTINYIVWEAFNPAELSYYKQFSHLICPTKSSYKLLKEDYQLANAQFIPWGVDLSVYQWQEPIPKQKPIIFFPAGWGGVADRKNEDAVIKAFSYVCPRDKSQLHIHTQQEGQGGQAQNIIKTSGTVDMNQLIQYYKESDVVVLPSRWEGNGLPFMEASALGRPIITCDAPPMNEKISPFINGLTCKVTEMKEVQGIFVKSAEIDCWDFAEKMLQLTEDKDLLYKMQLASRKYAEEEFNWKINSKKLIDILA